MEIRIAGTVNDSIVDGPGIRFTVFVQGCPHHCEGCHNPQTHDFNGGKLTDTEELFQQIQKNPLLKGVTFSGGEPFCQAAALTELAKKIHHLGLNVITYTGYTLEYLYAERDTHPEWKSLLEQTDYLIDGPFVLAQRSLLLSFRGSKNQRIISIRESAKQNKIITVEL